MVSALATALHAPRWEEGELDRILVIKTDHIGDFLLCLPAVREFVSHSPGAIVGFVVGSWNRPLAERVPWVDEVHVFDSPRYARRAAPSPESLLREILERGWDLVIDLTNDRCSALAALRRPSRYRRDAGTLRLREKVKVLLRGAKAAPDPHAARVCYRALGLPVPERIAPEGIELRPPDKEAAARLLARGWPGDRPVAAVHAGALWEHRCWPAVRFGELARGLEERGYSVFLVGGANDEKLSEGIAHRAGLRPERNLAGRTELPVAAAVLARAAVVVANDGGLLHLAAAQGVPVVGIFGPQDPARFGPLGERSVVLYHPRECSPCAQRHCVWGRARCLEPIETSAVLQAALRVAR